jgi:hypothetical protein
VAGDAGVEDAGGAGHDIDVVNHGRYGGRLYTRRQKEKRDPSTAVGMTEREERSLHCGRDDRVRDYEAQREERSLHYGRDDKRSGRE